MNRCTIFAKRLCISVAIALMLAPFAIGAPIIMAHQGRILDPIGQSTAPELDALVGEFLRVDFTFDSNTPDDDPDPTRGRYLDPLGSITVTVGNNVYTSTGVDLLIEDTQQGDLFTLAQFVSGPLLTGAPQAAVGLTFIDTTGAAFSNDRLPLSPPSPSDFNNVGLALAFGPPADDIDPVFDDFDLSFGPGINPPVDDDDGGMIFTTVDDFDGDIRRFDTHSLRTSQIQAVPEPVTVATAVVGLVCAATLLIRRQMHRTP